MKNLENYLNGEKGDIRVMESSTNITRSHQHPQYHNQKQHLQDNFYYQKQQHQETSSAKCTSHSVKSHNLQSPQHIALLKASTMSPTVAHSNTLPTNINRSSAITNQYRNGVHTPNDSSSNNTNLNNHDRNYMKSGNANVLNNNLHNLELENKKMACSSSSYILSPNGDVTNGGAGTSSYSLPRGFKADKFEIPLPFGYHLDLDFLRF